MTPAIEINNLSVRFQDNVLFESLSLTVNPGDKINIAGPSGSGKSTLLRCIMGFASPASGVIQVMGKELCSANIWDIRGSMAYVAQEPELGDGNVRDALMRPFGYKRNASLAYNEQDTLFLFEALLLPPALIDTSIDKLSGGEKQRIALIIALILKRPLLLLDEAASALDLGAKQAVRDYLRNCNDHTILSVSHDTRDFSLSSTNLNVGAFSKGGVQ